MYQSIFRLLPVFCLVLALSGCVTGTGKPGTTEGPLSGPVERQNPWQLYIARSQAAEVNNAAFRVSSNLRYTGKNGDSARVSSVLWGNAAQGAPSPLRLDLMAGMGSVVASIREDNATFAAYSPDEKKVFINPKGQRTLVSFGVPIPLTLSDLTLILTGRSGMLFLPKGATASTPAPAGQTNTAEGTRFPVHGAALPGLLELNAQGIPISWKEFGEDGWTIAMEPGEGVPMQPRRLRISHSDGYEAIIVVKEVTFMPAPFNAAQLELNVPAGTPTQTLETASR